MLAKFRLGRIGWRHGIWVGLTLMAAGVSVGTIAAEEGEGDAAGQGASSIPEPVIRVEEIVIKAPRVRIVSPLPGVGIDREQSATNIQSATAKEIAESRAINITEFMNNNMQSVSINDYAGNPFQQDLNFRGFTASPMIGTPQGISVYLDGVRVNEAFGDVVNWDLLPMNAIASMDLLPGSSPLFGLNTLGGALAIRTKTGFSDQHARAELIAGAWGRQQVQVSNGINNGVLGLFTAYNHFEEDGWRQNSPSNLRQLYNNLTLKLPKGELNLSALNVDTALTGNGLIPFEMAETNRKWVFTSPDESSNRLAHYNFNGRWDVNDYLSISALMYRRNMHQAATSGDVYDSYKRLLSAWEGSVSNAQQVNGMFNFTNLEQKSKGWSLQASMELGQHQLTAGMTYDSNHIEFLQSQLLAAIDSERNVNLITDPEFIDAGYFQVFRPIIRNDLKGSSTSKSIFMSDTWTITDGLHLTYGGRFNWSNVKNTLVSDRGKDLYNFSNADFNPLRQRCKVDGSRNVNERLGRFVCSEGDYDYRSFNPAIGIVWQPVDSLSIYGNVSRGSRVPTVIELGCARDRTKDNEPASTNYQYGCSIPTALSADPYLKQVRSTSYEQGVRGVTGNVNWNIGLFRTELKDDILFVPLGRKNRGVFDNFGQTLRQGIEMGMSAEAGKSRFRLNYTYMLATFESAANAINPNNSSNTASTTLQSFVNIEPGDSLPGMPRHIFQASWNYRMNDRFDATLSMVMHSSAYVRGNENNEHQARAATHTVYAGADRDPYDYIGAGTTPGYAVFNLRANYNFDGGITLFLKADNLFNKEYVTAGDLGRNPFGANGQFKSNADTWQNTTFIGPGAPRAIWVGLAFDWDWKKLAAKKD